MKSKKALRNFIIWVSLAFIFNIVVLINLGKESAIEFLSGYIVELSLSVDNLFLFLIIFTSFNIPVEYQKRVLTYGIFGAMILRFIFIIVGITVINKFHWILYLFSLFLMVSGIKIFIEPEEPKDYSQSKLLILLDKILPVTHEFEGDKFFIRKKSVVYATPLFLILILIEFSDLIFALDSIPAIFSITTNIFIVYTSNMFAILGLRSLYFLLVKLNSMFTYMKYGVGCILIFTGIKIFVAYFNIIIPTIVSLLIIMIIVLLCILISLLRS